MAVNPGSFVDISIQSCSDEIINFKYYSLSNDEVFDVDETLKIIANKALESARGNSGTIIAQFFHGMRRSCENKKVLYITDFAQAFQFGFKSAKASLLQPEEGTIITVMDDKFILNS